MKSLRTLGATTLFLALLLTLLVSPSTAQDNTGGTIIWGVPADATGVDIQTNGQDASQELLAFVYDQLVDLDDQQNVVPGLAESWEQVDDTTYTFHLRHGVKFSNGREMTADDVVTSITRVADPKLGSYLLNYIPLDSATKVDDYTVQIKLKSPNGAFLQAMALEAASIIPGKEFEAGTFDPTTDVMGTGPFMLKEHLPDESWTFVRNPYYWQEGLPKADSLVAKILPEQAAMLAALRDGSINIAVLDDFDALNTFAEQPNVEADVQSLTQYYVLTLNSVNPDSPFLDKRVREAINMAIDKQQIADLVFGGHEQVAVPGVGSSDACDTSTVPFGQFDPDQARQLLQDAGAQGLSFKLWASPGPMLSMAQVIQAQLTDVGLNPTIETPDLAETISRVYGGFTADKPGEGVADISYNVTGASVVFGYTNWGANWMSGVSTLAFDQDYADTLAKAIPMPAGADRSALLTDLCTRIYDNASHLPLVTKSHIIAFRKDLLNATIQPTELSAEYLRHAAEFTVIASS